MVGPYDGEFFSLSTLTIRSVLIRLTSATNPEPYLCTLGRS